MTSKNKVEVKEIVESYTLNKLVEDIQDAPISSSQALVEVEKAQREYLHKLKVLLMLTDLPQRVDTVDGDDENKARMTIERMVNNDEVLAGFNFYLSHNAQFDYTWNHLRKKVDQYVNFLLEIRRFMITMMADINTMAKRLSGEDGIKILFHDVFEIDVKKEAPYARTIVKWENFDRLAAVRRGYYVTVKKGDAVLMTCFKNYNAKAEEIVEKTIKMIERSKKED